MARRRRRCWTLSRPALPRRLGSVAGSFSRPSMRATSSMRSASRVTSLRRKAGTSTSRPPGASSTPKPRARRISAWRGRGIGRPRISSTRCSRRRMTMPGGPSPPTSIVPGTRRAPVNSSMSRVATIWASIACSGARPFSKRPLASLRSPRTCDVRWMLGPSQLATSISTRVVPSWTSERSPPMTPAIEVGPSASSMTSIWASRVRTCPSRVVTCSPSRARRTTSLPPATRSRSKACSGLPTSSIT